MLWTFVKIAMKIILFSPETQAAKRFKIHDSSAGLGIRSARARRFAGFIRLTRGAATAKNR
jgi:hypothetical protein